MCMCAHKPLCGLLNFFVIIARILITGLSYDLILEPFLEVWRNGLSSKVLSDAFLAYFNVWRSLQPLLSSYNNFLLHFFRSFCLFILWHSCATSQVWSCGRQLVLFLPLCISWRWSPQSSAFYPHWAISPTLFSYGNKNDIYQFLLNCGTWCCMPLWRENLEIKASLGYTQWNPVSQTKRTKSHVPFRMWLNSHFSYYYYYLINASTFIKLTLQGFGGCQKPGGNFGLSVPMAIWRRMNLCWQRYRGMPYLARSWNNSWLLPL